MSSQSNYPRKLADALRCGRSRRGLPLALLLTAALGSVSVLGSAVASATTFATVSSTSNLGKERCLTGAGSASVISGGSNSCSNGTSSSAFNHAMSIAQLVADDLSAQHSGQTITLTRLDDGNPNNNLFTYIVATVAHPGTEIEARARYANNADTFGILAGSGGGSFTQVAGPFTNSQVLLKTNSTFGDANTKNDIKKNAALPSIALPVLADGSLFRPAIQGPGGSYTFTSVPGENPGFLDHMVAYKITGLDATLESEGIFSYLLGFEDGTPGDRDYNDVVLELDFSAVRVPAPATLLLFGVALLGLGVARLRKEVAP